MEQRMSSEPIDYQAVLDDLEDRRLTFNESIDAAIRGIKQMLALSVGGATGGQAAAKPMTGSYLGMSLVEAAKRHLARVGQPQSNAEIAEALEQGGFVHSSDNFTNTVGTALWRAQNGGDREIFRDKKRWYLKAWAPNYRPKAFASLNPADAVDEPEGTDGHT